MGARVFVWLGGAMFVAALTLCAWCYGLVLSRWRPFTGSAPILADILLITIFGLHHSLFARERVKQWMARRVPGELLRSVYVWIASALLMLVCLSWRPVGGEL